MNWFEEVATLVCAAGMALFYFLMDVSRRSPRKIHTEGREFRMPDMRFHYTPDALYATFDQAGDERGRMRRYWLLDFGFILCFWGVMLLVALNVDGQTSALFFWMGVAATARALLDIAENLLLLRLLRAYPARREGQARAAALITSLKYICLYAWVAMLFFRLFAHAFHLVG